VEELATKDSPNKKEYIDLLMGGEGREDILKNSFGMSGIEFKVTCGDLSLFIAIW